MSVQLDDKLRETAAILVLHGFGENSAAVDAAIEELEWSRGEIDKLRRQRASLLDGIQRTSAALERGRSA